MNTVEETIRAGGETCNDESAQTGLLKLKHDSSDCSEGGKSEC